MAQRTTNVTLNKAVKQAGKISITELQDAIDAQKPIPAAVTELVAAVLAAGIRARASSIHIEPGPDGVRLRQRIDGILTEIDKLPLPIGPILVAGLPALVHVPASEQTLPQQANMTVIVQEKPY